MAFTDSQYDELMHTYYQNQLNNRALADERKAEVYKAVPRIEEIDHLIATSSLNAARARLKQGVNTTEATKEQNRLLIAEKEALLEKNGYPVDYLKPIYTCPLCKDTARVDGEYCSCFKQSAISLLYKQSTLDNILQTENFEHFNLGFYPDAKDPKHPDEPTPRKNMEHILSISKQFIKDFDEKGGNLLFYGDTGLGKTFLSNCIAKELLDNSHTVLYQSSIHLFEDVCAEVILKKGQLPGSQETYRYLYDCDLLIIDDLGTEYTNSFVSSELYDILNTRLRTKKSTLISTNLNLEQLMETYSSRIATRIFADYEVCNFYGTNIRWAKRSQTINN